MIDSSGTVLNRATVPCSDYSRRYYARMFHVKHCREFDVLVLATLQDYGQRQASSLVPLSRTIQLVAYSQSVIVRYPFCASCASGDTLFTGKNYRGKGRYTGVTGYPARHAFWLLIRTWQHRVCSIQCPSNAIKRLRVLSTVPVADTAASVRPVKGQSMRDCTGRLRNQPPTGCA